MNDILNRFRSPPRWSGPLCLSFVFTALAALTWRKWPHPLIDSGRELYIPWRLSEGGSIYSEIAYFNGPFSPYWNALWFRLFGASLTTLVVVNLILLAALTSLLYCWLVRSFDRLTAFLASLSFLCVFAFAQLEWTGNYNYICPYSHEMTHGVLLSFLMLFALSAWTQGKTRLRLLGAGICWGLVFLGKPEIFLAASGGAVAAIMFPLAAKKITLRCWSVACLIFVASALLPVILFWGLLWSKMPGDEALLGLAGAWRWILTTEVAESHFYKLMGGLEKPWIHFVDILVGSACLLLILAAAICFDCWRSDQKTRFSNYWIAAAGICFLLSYPLRGQLFPYVLEGRALWLVALLMMSGLTIHAWRHRAESAVFEKIYPLAAWSVFATLLMAKMMLWPRIFQYGFVLAMPATILAVACMLGFLPRLVCRRWGGGPAFRIAVIGFLLVDCSYFVFVSSKYMKPKTLALGRGGDRLLVASGELSPMGPMVVQALDDIEKIMPTDSTLAVLPEGVMLNYLSRRKNPTGHINFMPPELMMFGEREVVDSFDQNPPDYILLVHKNTSEYGVGLFGSDRFGGRILNWVEENYQPIKLIGHEPLRNEKFGIKIMVRHDLVIGDRSFPLEMPVSVESQKGDLQVGGQPVSSSSPDS